MFQRQRVDMLLGELLRKFPLPMIPQMSQPAQQANQNGGAGGQKTETDQRHDFIKQEPHDGHQNNGLGKHPLSNDNDMDIDIKSDIKNEMKPPPEKKMK